MGFYNVLEGDAPYLRFLADTYAMSDNYHQAVMGGTGANHVMLGSGDAIWFTNAHGQPAMPPHNQLIASGSSNAGVVDEIENPNPQAGTNNWYTEDGYGGGSFGSASQCTDTSRSEVAQITDFLGALSTPIDPRCQPGHYYLLNNYNPGYYGNGQNAYADINNPLSTVFTIPPAPLKTIGDTLIASNISWAYYGDQWGEYLANPYLNYVTADNTYCNICNPFQYTNSIMRSASGRAHLQDTTNLYQAELWKSTAIFVTFDEGGGYYDSGYVQPLDYFGDGTRIPLLIVSPYATGGRVNHSYADHVSLLKFIERNWNLPPVTSRSRDNFPNPKTSAGNLYVPTNSPALDDLFDAFNFTGHKK